MDLNAASMFVAVVRAGSLSAAAPTLGMPLATLSRRLRQFETALNVQLLERSARGVKLTEPGARLYERASQGIDWLTEAEAVVRESQSALRGRLRLSIPPSFEPWWALLRGFQRKYPEICMTVHVNARRVDLVQDGVDVALRIGEPHDDDVVARRLLSFRHVLVAAPSLIERLGAPAQVNELAAFPCATWAANSSSPARWQLGDESIDLKPVLSTNDYAHLRQCVETGDVVTELPEFLARPSIKAGRLRELLAHRPFPLFVVQLLYLPHRHPSSIVRAYLDYCTEEAERIVAG